jgi:hypothetical protein
LTLNEPKTQTKIQFPAVIGYRLKWDLKANKKTKKTEFDIIYEKGKLTFPSHMSSVCHCYLTDKYFSSYQFNQLNSFGIQVIPGISIPIFKSQKTGEPYIKFSFGEIIDYKILTKRGPPRLCINTYNFYVFINSVSLRWIDLNSNNEELILKCLRYYESIGIKSKDGSREAISYYESFTNYINNQLIRNEGGMKIKRKLNYFIPTCPKHKKTGQYNPQNRQFYCKKCKKYFN